jgi:triosephosphate isomerase
MPRTPLIAGNWKMNTTPEEARTLANTVGGQVRERDAADAVEVCVCPPFPLIFTAVMGLGPGPAVAGAQDCHAAEKGAHTGDVAAEMLAAIGCRYVIVGHSERRTDHGETDALVKAKAEAAHRAGMTAIVCVGETETEREAGETETVVERQVRGSLPDAATAADTVIAYEPVWAIGTGKTASPQDAQAVHAHIRAVVADTHGAETADAMRILYGGSMKPGNAADLLSEADIDGGLIGGASLKADDFLGIVDAGIARAGRAG